MLGQEEKEYEEIQVEDKADDLYVDNEDVGLRGDLKFWRKKAKDEWKSARATQLKNLTGIHTTLCLDISDSMQNNGAREQAKTFVTEYLSGIRSEFAQKRIHQNTALVTFGHVTKVQQRLTKDIDALEQSLDHLNVGGPSPLLAGLILAKASVTVSNFLFASVNNITVPPRIIVITDGKATDVNDKNEVYFQDQYRNEKEVKQLIIDEVVDIRDAEIEIHFVHVGIPDIVFLQKLQDTSGGKLMSYTSGQIIAKDVIFKCIIKQDEECLQKELKKPKREKVEGSVDEEGGNSNEEKLVSSMLDAKRELMKMLLPGVDFGNSDITGNDSDEESSSQSLQGISGLLDTKYVTDLLSKKFDEQDFYKENQEMQKYAPIGSRVRRGQDWRWGNQDHSYLGTIIGHSYDKMKKHWCWVEWDADGEINAYRWHINGPCDLKIVEEDRIPVDGKKFDVGSRIKPGTNYKGERKHEEGIVMKLIDEKTIQVRWKDDGSREDLSFGDDNTSCEAEPLPISFSNLKTDELEKQNSESDELSVVSKFEQLAPRSITVYDVYEHSACLEWKTDVKDADISKKKYVVTYGEPKYPHKRTTLEVSATLSCTLNDLKAGTEYKAEVKLVDGERESLPALSDLFKTMETDKDESHYAGWKLTSRDAAQLALAIGANWENLGKELGISHLPIKHVTDNKSSSSGIYYILQKWMKQTKDATFGNFLKALENVPEVSVDRSVIHSMKQVFRLMESEGEIKDE